jgi:hypothetical protein
MIAAEQKLPAVPCGHAGPGTLADLVYPSSLNGEMCMFTSLICLYSTAGILQEYYKVMKFRLRDGIAGEGRQR